MGTPAIPSANTTVSPRPDEVRYYLTFLLPSYNSAYRHEPGWAALCSLIPLPSLSAALPPLLFFLSNLFFMKTSKGFRDGHIWYSIFSRSPRSCFTRAQRVSCCFSLLLCTMLTSIMFWGVPKDPAEQKMDLGIHPNPGLVFLGRGWRQEAGFQGLKRGGLSMGEKLKVWRLLLAVGSVYPFSLLDPGRQNRVHMAGGDDWLWELPPHVPHQPAHRADLQEHPAPASPAAEGEEAREKWSSVS